MWVLTGKQGVGERIGELDYLFIYYERIHLQLTLLSLGVDKKKPELFFLPTFFF